MAICLIIENPDQSREQAEQAIAGVRSTGPVPPDGARLLMGGQAGDGWRFVSVWDSEEALERFLAERLLPAYGQVGMSFDAVTETRFELHTLLAGDLTGTPQPA